MNQKSLIIRKMKQGEEEVICHLVRNVFAKFIAPLYAKEGVEEFEKYINPELLAKRVKTDRFILVGEVDTELIGVIEVREFNHISLLFVTQEWQGQGVARKLLHEALVIAKKSQPTLTTVTVNSSPNAVGAYKALGFEVAASEKLDRGIRFIPMCMRLSELDDN